MATAADKKTGFATMEVVAGVLTAILLLVAATLFLQGGFQALQNREYAAKIYGQPATIVNPGPAEQQALLDEGPRWLDEQHAKVVLPIDLAIEIFATKHAAGDTGNAGTAQ